jgi:hypothetical protein
VNGKQKISQQSTVPIITPEDPSKPYALEVIDPGCVFCAELFKNIKEADVESRYNLTYMAYPIPDPNERKIPLPSLKAHFKLPRSNQNPPDRCLAIG